MEKTKNKILVGCLALLLLMAVGYALFSESITINGTSTAKGEFDFTVTCVNGISEELSTSGITFASEAGYKDDSCSVDGYNVTFNTALEYPTARRYFTIKVINTGTITAVDESMDIATQMANDINSKNCQYNSSDNTLVRCLKPNVGDTASSKSKYILKDKDGVITEITNREKLILNPGDTFYAVIGITWPYQFQSNSFKNGYYFELTRGYTLDFKQQLN